MIKKPLAIILAFFIVFSPVYSYAVLPALAAAAASAGGRVLVGNAIKRVGQAALSKAGMASIAAGVASTAGIKSAIESDGWTIDYGSGGGGAGGSWDAPNGGGVDSEGNIDIEIYKMPPNDGCEIQVSFGTSYLSAPDFYNRFLDNYNSKNSNSRYLQYSGWSEPFDSVIAFYKSPSFDKRSATTEWKSSSGLPIKFRYDRQAKSSGEWNPVNSDPAYNSSVIAYYRCMPYPVNKNYITNNEFNAYLTKNITNNQAGDIIKNIYNYDYSQHPNITINNNTTGGNSLNNDLSVNVDPNADIRVSPRLRLDIESNKVNLDNVNDTNCTKNEAGEYDNCTGEEDPEEETDPDDPNNPSPEEPSPIECDANGFYRKVCDWMDWTKKEHTEPTDTNVDVTDKTSEIVIDDSRISFDDQCPTPKDINITVVGHSFSDALDYQPLCDFFIKLKPFVVGIGGISSALIIAGGVRRG